MSEFVEVKTSDLTGHALDWAVAKACRYECGWLPRIGNTLGCNLPDGLQYVIGRLCCASIAEELNARFFRPSTDWAQGGPIMERENVTIERSERMRGCAVVGFHDWYATHPKNYGGLVRHAGRGQTILAASCRAIVSAKLGDVVQVPKELI